MCEQFVNFMYLHVFSLSSCSFPMFSVFSNVGQRLCGSQPRRAQAQRPKDKEDDQEAA